MRLSDLAKGFEEATIDKNDQEKKTIKMDKLLETAGRLRKVLRKERARIQQVMGHGGYINKIKIEHAPTLTR